MSGKYARIYRKNKKFKVEQMRKLRQRRKQK